MNAAALILELASNVVDDDGHWPTDWSEEDHLAYLDHELGRQATFEEWRLFVVHRASEAIRHADRLIAEGEIEDWLRDQLLEDLRLYTPPIPARFQSQTAA